MKAIPTPMVVTKDAGAEWFGVGEHEVQEGDFLLLFHDGMHAGRFRWVVQRARVKANTALGLCAIIEPGQGGPWEVPLDALVEKGVYCLVVDEQVT